MNRVHIHTEMSDFKQVHVRLSPLDQKTLSRTPKRATRKQRLPKEQLSDSLLLHESDNALRNEDAPTLPTPTLEPVVVQKPAPAPKPVAIQKPVPPPKPVAIQKPLPEPEPASTPEPVLKSKKIVPAEPAVHIQSKPISVPVPDVKLPSPKILPTKKRPTDVPAILTKKSKFVISPIQSRSKAPSPVGNSNSEPGANKTMKKHYKERKISIQIRTNDQTKKFKNKLDQEIPTMPIANVKKFLLKSGVLKVKHTYPPEEILRSMMRDYMLLHTIE